MILIDLSLTFYFPRWCLFSSIWCFSRIVHRFWIKFKHFWNLLFSKLLKKWFILMKLKWNLGHLNIEIAPGYRLDHDGLPAVPNFKRTSNWPRFPKIIYNYILYSLEIIWTDILPEKAFFIPKFWDFFNFDFQISSYFSTIDSSLTSTNKHVACLHATHMQQTRNNPSIFYLS